MPDACIEDRQQRPLRGGEALRAMAAGASAWPATATAADAAPLAVGDVLERLARLQTQIHHLGQPQPQSAVRAPAEDGRRGLQRPAAALGAVVRRLDQEADALGAGAQRLMQQAQALQEAPPGEEPGRLLGALERLESRLQRLEQQPVARAAPSRDLDGLRQLALGFRLALQEVQIGARALEDAAAALRPAAGGVAAIEAAAPSWRTALTELRGELAAEQRTAAAPVLSALEALRAEVAALADFQQQCGRGFVPENPQIQAFGASNPTKSGSEPDDNAPGARKPGAAVSLEADRAELRRLLLGFKSVLERLERQEPVGAQNVAQVGRDVGEAIAQHVKLSIAEALAFFQQQCASDRVQSSPPRPAPAPGGGAREAIAAVDALTARLARLHADLHEHAAASGGQGGDDPEAAALLAQRLSEARACCSEMLDVAVALTRELAPPAPQADQPKPPRAGSRGLLSRRG